jgi:hypothetical protein
LSGNASAEGGDTNVVLRLAASNYGPGAKTGKLRGIVTDPEGKPVSGAQVAVFPSQSTRTKTGPDGSFSLNWMMQSWQLQSGDEPRLVVRDLTRNLAAADNISEGLTNLDMQLEPALSVIGRVEGPDGNPLSDAQVGVSLLVSRTSSEVERTHTDAQGNFAIKAMPLGLKYSVSATAKDHGRRQQEIDNSSLKKRIDLPPFVLALADKVLAGQVVDAQDKPVAGSNVSLSGRDQPSGSATTDTKGRFSFKVCEGSIRLYANGSSGSANITADAGDTNVVLQLSRNAIYSRMPASFPRNLKAFGLAADAAPAGKPLLVCLFDAEQPPSRRTARRLADRYDALQQKGIAVLAIQAGIIPAKTWQAWTNSNPLPFPLGRAAEKSVATKWVARVDSLPWLILRNARGAVVAEGFAFDELDAKLKAVK